MHCRARLDITPLEALYGFHANQAETALLRALAPMFTRQERAVTAYPASLDDPGELRPECAPATFSWASQDISPSGIMGDAAGATVEQGHRWHAQLGEGFFRELARWCAEGRASAREPA